MPASDLKVEIDLNDRGFQRDLFALDREVQRAAIETLRKISNLTWTEVYRDAGLKWEKVNSIKPLKGISAIYSLRLTRARRATAWREGNIMRFLSIPPDHDATYGRK